MNTITLYKHEDVVAVNKKICEDIKNKLNESHSNLKNYKTFVHCVIGEKKGQGIKMGSKCLWDTTTDNMVSASYENDVVYGVVSAFGVYYY